MKEAGIRTQHRLLLASDHMSKTASAAAGDPGSSSYEEANGWISGAADITDGES